MDCGPTCIKIVARYWGRIVPLSYLRSLSFAGREGSSLLGMSKAAEQIGLNTLAVKIDFHKLIKEAPLPAILHWNQNHFVVVYKISKSKVYISDPGNGLLKYTHEQFLKHWIGASAKKDTEEGIALLLEPTPLFKSIELPKDEDKQVNPNAFLWHYIRPHRRVVGQILLSLVLGSILQLILPFLTQNIVDTGIAKKDINFIWLILAAQLMLTFGQLFLEVLQSYMLVHISGRINIRLVSDFFIKLMRLPIRYFDSRLTGDIFQRINDHKRIESFLTGTSLSTVFSLFTLLLYGGVLAYYNLTLFGIFLLGSVLYMLWILVFLKRRKKLDYKRFQQAASNNSKEIELINGMQEIKLHNAEQEKRWSWERIQIKLYHLSVQSLILEQSQNSGGRIINELKNIFVSIISATLVIKGDITLGMMLSISFIIGQLNGPIMQLIGVIQQWQDARISLQRIAEIYSKSDEQEVIHDEDMVADPIRNVPSRHDIKLDYVSFQYDGLSPMVLQDLSITIPHGKVTAIVGSSGSGKTTLLKMLMRFYEPTLGVINIDSTDLQQINLSHWRTLCGVVMQEGYIFNDTIAGNIAIGSNDEIDWDKMEKATQIANISEFIQTLPLGYNTKIGMEGIGVSTGQKQRILIARAVYKNPDILFFDEATSALDANNEKVIMQNLEEFYKGKTVVIIAHRLSTVKNADNILVLEKGNIIESGTHQELVAFKGRYFELIKNQLELGN